MLDADPEAEGLFARFEDQGEWQQFVIEKKSGDESLWPRGASIMKRPADSERGLDVQPNKKIRRT
jgi:hypothetical protein